MTYYELFLDVNRTKATVVNESQRHLITKTSSDKNILTERSEPYEQNGALDTCSHHYFIK